MPQSQTNSGTRGRPHSSPRVSHGSAASMFTRGIGSPITTSSPPGAKPGAPSYDPATTTRSPSTTAPSATLRLPPTTTRSPPTLARLETVAAPTTITRSPVGTVNLSPQVAEYADDEPGAQLSRLSVSA